MKIRTISAQDFIGGLMGKHYEVVATYQSRSNPNKVYEVKKDDEGNYSCNCPAWVYKRNPGPRICKHVIATQDKFEKFTMAGEGLIIPILKKEENI